MVPVDAQVNFQPPRAADVQHIHAAWQSFGNLLASSAKVKQGLDAVSKDTVVETGATAPAAKIENHGQIKEMTLPVGWEEGPSRSGGIGARSFREVHPRTSPDARLCFYYRCLPVSELAAANFKAVLDQPPHVLSAREISSLGEILRGKDKAEAFKPLMIKTEDLNGKRVLSVNGRITEGQEDLKEILVNADGSGKVVQEIFFQAPKELYTRYMKAARDSMATIQWK